MFYNMLRKKEAAPFFTQPLFVSIEHFVLNQYRNNPDFIPELDFVMEGRILRQFFDGGNGGALLAVRR